MVKCTHCGKDVKVKPKKIWTVITAYGGIADFARSFTTAKAAQEFAEKFAREEGYKSVDDLNESEDSNIWILGYVLNDKDMDALNIEYL